MQIVYRNCNPVPGLVGIVLLFDIARKPEEKYQAVEMFKESLNNDGTNNLDCS